LILQDVVRTLGEVEIDRLTSKPKKRVKITDSGLERLVRKYELEADQRDSTDDL
jgi:spore maturation protein CgeB